MTYFLYKDAGERAREAWARSSSEMFIWQSLLCWKNCTFLSLESNINLESSVTKPSVSIWWSHNHLCKVVAWGLLCSHLLVNMALCNQGGQFCYPAFPGYPPTCMTKSEWDFLHKLVVGSTGALQTSKWRMAIAATICVSRLIYMIRLCCETSSVCNISDKSVSER